MSESVDIVSTCTLMTESYFSNGFLTRLSENKSGIADETAPRISVVMPSFNQGPFIEKSILSVLNQQYTNIELIIVDGGSEDETIDIIRRYEGPKCKLIMEDDEGQSDALNKGFAAATGDIYGWLNSDDLYVPHAFETASKILKGRGGPEIVFGDWLSVDSSDNVIDLHYAFDFCINHLIYEGFTLNAQAMFWSADVHKDFRGFYIDLHNTMDYQMMLDFGLRKSNAFCRVPVVLGAFRRYEGQKTTALSPRVVDEHKKISERYALRRKYSSTGSFIRLVFRFRRLRWYFLRGGLTELVKRVSEAFRNRA